jgi:hypothetical protein
MADWTVRPALFLLRQQGRWNFQADCSHALHPRKPRAIWFLRVGSFSVWKEKAGNQAFRWLAACSNPQIELQKGWWLNDRQHLVQNRLVATSISLVRSPPRAPFELSVTSLPDHRR